MNLSNQLVVLTSRKRWLKRLFKNVHPTQAYKRIFDAIDFYFDPRDMKGPSFHFSYDLEEGFLNYEDVSKKELLKALPEDGIMYDIGANIGMYTVFFAKSRPQAQIFSFEPESLAHSCLEKTLASFPSSKIRLFKKAVGVEAEVKKLFHSTVNDGGHSFLTARDDQEKKFGDYEEVEVVNIDKLLEKNEILGPDVVKIDVEGFELEVLKGMQKTIEDFKPLMLVEADNKDMASAGGVWSFFDQLKVDQVQVSLAGNQRKYSLQEIAGRAQEEVSKSELISNYFFFLS